MKEYKQPKVLLPVSMNHSFISKIQHTQDMGGEGKGSVEILLENGFLIAKKEGAVHTTNSSVVYEGVNFDACKIQALRGEKRRILSFEQMSHLLRFVDVEIIDVTYGYNITKLWCYAYPNDEHYAIEIKIYHDKETLYRWEE